MALVALASHGLEKGTVAVDDDLVEVSGSQCRGLRKGGGVGRNVDLARRARDLSAVELRKDRICLRVCQDLLLCQDDLENGPTDSDKILTGLPSPNSDFGSNTHLFFPKQSRRLGGVLTYM